MEVDTDIFKKKRHPVKSVLSAVFNFIGGVSGIIALMTYVFYGGQIVEKVRTIDARLTKVEDSGSSVAREYIRENNARFDSMAVRLRNVEDGMMTLYKLDAKIDANGLKLDALKDSLEEHRRTTTSRTITAPKPLP